MPHGWSFPRVSRCSETRLSRAGRAIPPRSRAPAPSGFAARSCPAHNPPRVRGARAFLSTVRYNPHFAVGPEIHESHLSSRCTQVRSVRCRLDHLPPHGRGPGDLRRRRSSCPRLAAFLRHPQPAHGRRHRFRTLASPHRCRPRFARYHSRRAPLALRRTPLGSLSRPRRARWRYFPGHSRRPHGPEAPPLLASRHACLHRSTRFRHPRQHRFLHQPLVDAGPPPVRRPRLPVDSRHCCLQRVRHLRSGSRGCRLSAPLSLAQTPCLRRSHCSRDGVLDRRRASPPIPAGSRNLARSRLASLHRRPANPSWNRCSVDAHRFRRRSPADAARSRRHGRPHRRRCAPLCHFHRHRAFVLSSCTTQKGSALRYYTGRAASTVSSSTTEAVGQAKQARAYTALTKPEVSSLVLMTTGAGFYMGARGPMPWLHMLHVIFGTMMIAAGTAALNHYIERESDRFMRRTASRPLPTGQLTPAEALRFGLALALAGAVDLYYSAGSIAGLLGVFTSLSYLLV